jgi:hypothetical protein
MTSRSLFVLATLVMLAFVSSRPAVADVKPENVFAGKIIVSDKRFPTRANSGRAFVAAVRKQSKAQFMEDKEQKWRIYFAAFFKRPLADIEVIVKLYDLNQPGTAPFASFEQYISERGGRTLLSDFVLERKLVGVNRHVQMVLEVGGRPIASGKFKILGEAERFKGRVDFSEEETDDDEE